MKRSFSPIFALIPVVFAACGTDITPHPKYDAAPKLDATVVVVYVSPDAAPPMTPTCTCSDPCHCVCDYGAGVTIPASTPGCVSTTTADAATVNTANDSAVPTKNDVATTSFDVATAKDMPSDPIAINRDSAFTDSASARDALIPEVAIDRPATDSTHDSPMPFDAKPDTAPDVPLADLNPDMGVDLGPDLPPPDTRPCTSAPCRCPAGSLCKPTALMTLDHLTDYSILGYSSYYDSQNGFGVYSQNSPNSMSLVPNIKVSVGAAPELEIDTSYNYVVKIESVVSGDFLANYYDWFSLRRELTSQMDACGCSGIAFELKGNTTSPRPEAGLRFSLADTICKNPDDTPILVDGGIAPDEVWWHDITQSDFGETWTTIKVPLDSFYAGVRYNDGKLDLRCVKAFELSYQYNVDINCINGCSRKANKEGSGHFEVRNLTTY